MVKRGDIVEYEYEQAKIDDIRNNQTIEITKGKNDKDEEWQQEKLFNFLSNYEKVNKKGKN